MNFKVNVAVFSQLYTLSTFFRQKGSLYPFSERLCGLVGPCGLTWRRETLLVL